VVSQRAQAVTTGIASWSTAYGNKQGAAFTFFGAPLDGTSLLLKASGASVGGVYANYVRVRYQAGSIVAETTVNAGLSFTNVTTAASGVSFASGESMAAMCDAAGNVTVWKIATNGTTTTLLGQATLPVTSPTAFVAAGGRTGIRLPTGGTVDNFRAGTVP
jgi:YD repeat-containing protein